MLLLFPLCGVLSPAPALVLSPVLTLVLVPALPAALTPVPTLAPMSAVAGVLVTDTAVAMGLLKLTVC